MKKKILLIVFLTIGTYLFASWDGIVKCNITELQVADGQNYGFRVVTDVKDLLNKTTTQHDPIFWAYLNEGESNYATYVSMLSLAFTMGYQVELYVKEVKRTGNTYFAHIGYIRIQK